MLSLARAQQTSALLRRGILRFITTALYMHRNPVKRGLVLEPQPWAWSSYRHYAHGERGVVLVNEQQKAEMKTGRWCEVQLGSVVPGFPTEGKLGQPQLEWCQQRWASPLKDSDLQNYQSILSSCERYLPSLIKTVLL